jgi:hypothetical protein
MGFPYQSVVVTNRDAPSLDCLFCHQRLKERFLYLNEIGLLFGEGFCVVPLHGHLTWFNAGAFQAREIRETFADLFWTLCMTDSVLFTL